MSKINFIFIFSWVTTILLFAFIYDYTSVAFNIFVGYVVLHIIVFTILKYKIELLSKYVYYQFYFQSVLIVVMIVYLSFGLETMFVDILLVYFSTQLLIFICYLYSFVKSSKEIIVNFILVFLATSTSQIIILMTTFMYSLEFEYLLNGGILIANIIFTIITKLVFDEIFSIMRTLRSR